MEGAAHAQITYAPFRRSFYTEVPELARMDDKEVASLRKELDGIKATGLAAWRTLFALLDVWACVHAYAGLHQPVIERVRFVVMAGAFRAHTVLLRQHFKGCPSPSQLSSALPSPAQPCPLQVHVKGSQRRQRRPRPSCGVGQRCSHVSTQFDQEGNACKGSRGLRGELLCVWFSAHLKLLATAVSSINGGNQQLGVSHNPCHTHAHTPVA
jgi:hypothetical protein